MNKTTRRQFAAGVAGGALLTVFARSASAQQKINIRVAHVNPPTSEMHKGVVEVMERVTAKSGGRIEAKIFPSAQLGTTTDLIEQASQGEPVIAYTDAAYLSTFGVPELSILGGPFLIDSAVEGEKLANSALLNGWFERLSQKARVRVLGLNWFDGARHVVGKKPYPKPADMKGVKIRVPPIITWRRTFEPLGAIPVTVEAAEAYSALSQGVVDAAESPILSLKANLWPEVAPFITLTGHFLLFTGWVISDKALQALTPEDRAMIVAEFKLGGREIASRTAGNIAAVTREFEAKGVKFAQADLAAYRDITKVFYTQFPEWPAGLFEQVRAAATAA
jgi:TRAP-type transport system periplasmic protein